MSFLSRNRQREPPRKGEIGGGNSAAVDLAGLKLSSPVMTASGTSGYGAELGAFFDLAELGAVVVKSLAHFPHEGNDTPRLFPLPGSLLNSVGLPGPGVEKWVEKYLPDLVRCGAKVIVSIWGRSVQDYGDALSMLSSSVSSSLGLPSDVISAVEVNISCPNIEDRSKMFGHSPTATSEVISAVRGEWTGPLFVKLSPNTDRVIDVAEAALRAGADGLCAINTVFAQAIDRVTLRAALGAKNGGGLSGPAIHPIALRVISDLRKAFPDIAIVGVGGVVDAWSAFELILAGANAVQVGTASFADPFSPLRVKVGLEALVQSFGVGSIQSFVGKANEL